MDVSPIVKHGRLRIITVTGAVGVATVSLRPAANRRWAVINAWASHNEGANLNCNWDIYDGTNTLVIPAYSLATATYSAFMSQSNNVWGTTQTPWYILSNTVYGRFTAAGLGGAKQITIQALVLEYAAGADEV